jgi:hypothetical protein
MKTLDWSVETLGLDYNSTGLCNHLYLNQSSERNMIDTPGCSERTNFKNKGIFEEAMFFEIVRETTLLFTENI